MKPTDNRKLEDWLAQKSTQEPVIKISYFLTAELAVDRLIRNLEIRYKTEGDSFDRETMQKDVNRRSALIITKSLLLDEAERLIKEREQVHFEDWLIKYCPSGDVTSVKRQWKASSDYADFIATK